ncbi:MAG: NADH:ubiquinone reductase (Na(+)-transporting) subunit A [Pseudomonadales bacterium]
MAASRHIRLRRGLDLTGPKPASYREREAEPLLIENAPGCTLIGISGLDYVEMKPSLCVNVGDRVRAGQPLFRHRRAPDLCVPAPGSGRIVTVQRGAKRSLDTISIELDEPEHLEQPQITEGGLERADPAQIRAALLASGLWLSLRTRPFGRVPLPDAVPRRLFVTATDTRPFALDPDPIIAARPDDFAAGLRCLATLQPQIIHLCTTPAFALPPPPIPCLEHVSFSGPHPAGLVGTHLHHLGVEASLNADIWHLGYQDVLAIGQLYRTGRLDLGRIVSVAAPGPRPPRALRTRHGADLRVLLGDQLAPDSRLISGSLLDGRASHPGSRFLGRYHLQVTALSQPPAPDQTRVTFATRGRALARGLLSDLRRRPASWPRLTTALHGTPGGMLPVEAFDAIWPLRSPPAALLRALITGDADTAQDLGCLALDAEDLALCSYVCPGKFNYGTALDDVQRQLERNG